MAWFACSSDAEIERVGREDVCVITRDAAAIDERMVLEVPGDGPDLSVAAQVTEADRSSSITRYAIS